MKMIFLFTSILFLSLSNLSLSQVNPVPTTLDDFFLPGSQPDESGTLEMPKRCDNCHGGYDQAVEPAFSWRGSMMSQAARDPLFYACLAIANQDAPQSGDLCIRCHSPGGWLEGRSTPTDASALTADDRESVQCDFCHRSVRPSAIGINPYPQNTYYTQNTYTRDQTYLGSITQIPGTCANGMLVVDNVTDKRGPYTDANPNHQWYYSPFHQDANMCATCHDVSNPVYSKNLNGDYEPNGFGAAAPNFDPYSMFPIERTFSEWKMSAYNTPEGVSGTPFGGNKNFVSTCQDCHMRDMTGKGCNKNPPTRADLALHDLTGGNTFIPPLIEAVFPGESDAVALNAGMQRSTDLLQKAASMDLEVVDNMVSVMVTNETGHKLPSGYPEGRRIWLNIKAYNANDVLVYESGHYNSVSGELIHDDDIKVYEIKPGISNRLGPIVNLPAGPSFHFVLNDSIYSDNRIPPRGFNNTNFTAIQSPPVSYSYDDGQYWDETVYTLPQKPALVEAILYYQTTSKEYVEFLRDENYSNEWGQTLYNLWNQNGKSAPVVMVQDTWEDAVSGVKDELNLATKKNLKLIIGGPNPFNSQTKFSYTLPVDGYVRLSVYDASGSLVTDLLNHFQAAGDYSVAWQADHLSSGTYFVQLKCAQDILTKKVVLLR